MSCPVHPKAPTRVKMGHIGHWLPGSSFKAAWRRPHLAVQAHLHRAYLPCVLINAEELGAALLQDGVPQGCVVRFWVVSIRSLGSGHIGAWEGLRACEQDTQECQPLTSTPQRPTVQVQAPG